MIPKRLRVGRFGPIWQQTENYIDLIETLVDWSRGLLRETHPTYCINMPVPKQAMELKEEIEVICQVKFDLGTEISSLLSRVF
ncbi:MAG: hypothetical protein Ct9H300mP23_05460 [Nitrospinota bacterium]|nr:MAG: hypothetical protein Ct9H300mP23_05460 [Nitrospinota bacterium]